MIFEAKDVVGGYSASDQILKGVTVVRRQSFWDS